MNDIGKGRFKTWLVRRWFLKSWATFKDEVVRFSQSDHITAFIFAVILTVMAFVAILLK